MSFIGSSTVFSRLEDSEDNDLPNIYVRSSAASFESVSSAIHDVMKSYYSAKPWQNILFVEVGFVDCLASRFSCRVV